MSNPLLFPGTQGVGVSIVWCITCFCEKGWRSSSKNCQPGALQRGCSNLTTLEELLRFTSYRFYLEMIGLKRRNLRLVFTSDGVVVGVVIRSVKRYDLVKIKPTESEAEHWFCLWLRRLRSSENCIVGAASRSGRINQWQCSISGLAIGWVFRFCFRLRQPSFH